MASVLTEEVSGSLLARRLSILPAGVGLIGVAMLPLGAIVVGLTDAPRGWTLVGLAVSLVLATVMSGASFGVYLGLAVFGGAGLAIGGPPTFSELLALVLTVLAAHETVRFSLDARRPSRFGPGLIAGYLTRSIATAGLMVGATGIGWWLSDQPARAAVWVPIGLAAAALPLFVRSGAEYLADRGRLQHRILRAGIAAGFGLVVLSVVVVAAQARTAIESGVEPGRATPAQTTTVPPATVAADTTMDPATGQRVLALVGVATVILVLGALYLALRRQEAIFELDEIDTDLEDRTLGIALPGQADLDDEIIDVDDQDLTDLLHGLRLDMSLEADPGRAIRFGYANIERRLDEIGLARIGTETEREFLERALPSVGRSSSAMRSLTGLFERARFGHEAADETMRQDALAAVEDLLDTFDTFGSRAGEPQHPDTGNGDDGAGDR